MSGFKRSQPGLIFPPEKITPDEIDMYRVYTIASPAIGGAGFLASAGTSGTADVVAVTVVNRLPDYPRNVQFALAGSAAGMTGTLTLNGVDQFGSTIQEAFTFAGAANGGTVAGTRVFAQITSGTLAYGTAAGVGTPNIGFVPGTACLFGLPDKIRAATDVVHLGMSAGTGAITYNGGTIAGFVNVGMSAVRPAAALNGTSSIVVWYKSSFDATNINVVSNLSQAT